MPLRRRADPPLLRDRRRLTRDRRAAQRYPAGIRFPSRQEQVVQFLTRYLFAFLGLIFFNYGAE